MKRLIWLLLASILAASSGAAQRRKGPEAFPTTTTAFNATAVFSEMNQTVPLLATVTSPDGTVNVGTVSFIVTNSSSVQIGATAISGTVTNGAATAYFTLPGGTPIGTYTISACYSGGVGFQPSQDAPPTLTVVAPMSPTPPAGGIQPVTLDPPYQIHYFANLTAGDSYINISNDGARGSVGFGAAATALSVNTGTLCANVYVFAADEEFISCCSCPVTPDGLVALSAQNDLIKNTAQNTNLLGSTSAIVVKLLATVPTGVSANSAGSCTGSAFLAPASTATAAQIVLANGMVAWGSNIHSNTSTGLTPSPFGLTETPFQPASIDVSYTASSELNRLGYLCSIYTATGVQGSGQGSGTGICNSCRLGGLGAAKSSQ